MEYIPCYNNFMKKLTLTRNEKSQLTKEKIYNEALQLFQTKGYGETSIKDICEASGVSYGSFYHYFGYKHAILIQSAIEFSKTSAPTLALTDDNITHPFESLYAYFTAFGRHCDRVGYERASVAYHNLNIMQKDSKGRYAEYTQMETTKKLVAAAQERGTLNTTYDPETVINLLHVTCMGVLMIWTMDKGSFKMENLLLDTIVKIFPLFQP